jgi:hypothetical protein
MDAGRDLRPPETVTFRRFPDGFEIALLPLPWLRSTRRSIAGILLAASCLVAMGVFIVVGFNVFRLDDGGGIFAFGLFFCAVLTICAALLVGTQFNWNRGTAVLEAREGLLTLVHSRGHPSRQCPLSDISSVRVWPTGSNQEAWVLQITLRSRQQFSALEARRKSEIDWVAGLLRAALAPPRRAPSVSAAPAVLSAGGQCQVCGSAMEERVVVCARCRTPHHEECWTYNGSCSTYGCREIRFMRTA